ncbi:MAG TPA: ribonuclease HII [bacterium]|nr:ribonuclease HII [bacterium]
MPRPQAPALFPELKRKRVPGLDLENRFREQGYARVAGVDEAGRGPLAGPVVAAAVVLPESIGAGSPLRKVRDSKMLDAGRREALYEAVAAGAVDCAWAMCDAREIDEMNILAASLEAMRRAVAALEPAPDLILVDGNQPVPCRIPSVTVVKGDRLCLSIAAASILAKVIRDRIMRELHKQFPAYGFDLHKGYATAEHKKAILRNGPCPVHRRTFRGVKECV